MNISQNRTIAIFGSGVTDRWFKNVWQSTHGRTQPVTCFIDDSPITLFRHSVDGIPVFSESRFFKEFSTTTTRPLVFLARNSRFEQRAQALLRNGFTPNVDFLQYPDAPDYTIDWLPFYPTWEAARADTIGYEDPVNIEEHLQSGRSIREKAHSCTIDYCDQRLFAPFLSILPLVTGHLKVVDFGGALGAHYLKIKAFCPNLPMVWWVSETPTMARVGQEHFQTDELRFVSDPSQVKGEIDLVLASGSLHCVDDSSSYFDRLAALKPRFILIDRLPLTEWESDRILIQRVYRNRPTGSFETSYPVRFFSNSVWMERINQNYCLVMRWQDTHDIVQIGHERIVFSGLLLKARN